MVSLASWKPLVPADEWARHALRRREPAERELVAVVAVDHGEAGGELALHQLSTEGVEQVARRAVVGGEVRERVLDAADLELGTALHARGDRVNVDGLSAR